MGFIKKYTVLFILLGVLGVSLFYGGRFSPQQSISSDKNFKNQEVKIILRDPTERGEVVIFENITDGTFGMANLTKSLGFLWSYNGGVYGLSTEKNEPLEVTGLGTTNEDGEEQFTIGIKINNNDIEYIALGKGPQIPSNSSKKYNLTLDEVKEMNEIYTVTNVDGNFALIATDVFNEENLTITAFNKDGELIADNLFGGYSRTLKD